MSQTPSQLRKVPVHILDELSAKFLINLVSSATLFFVFPNFFFLPVDTLFSPRYTMIHSPTRSYLISFGCSSKSSWHIGSFWTSTALKKRTPSIRVELSSSRSCSSSIFRFSITMYRISTRSSRNGETTSSRSQHMEPFYSLPT